MREYYLTPEQTKPYVNWHRKPDIQDHSSLVLYILHYPRPLNGKRHYLGTTTYKRLNRRMYEHAISIGSSFTARLNQINEQVYLTHLKRIENRMEEAEAKRRGNYARYCPACHYVNQGAPIATITVPWLWPERRAALSEYVKTLSL